MGTEDINQSIFAHGNERDALSDQGDDTTGYIFETTEPDILDTQDGDADAPAIFEQDDLFGPGKP